MKDRLTKTIYFPHVIAGNKLGGKKHTFNDVNGGVKSLVDLKINPDKFLGGNSAPMIGFIEEYGFYACPHYRDRKDIVAFYIHDPKQVTDLGKKLIEESCVGYNVSYELVSPSIHHMLSQEQIAKKQELIKKVVDKGVLKATVSHATVDELEGVLQALDSGKSGLKVEQEGKGIVEGEEEVKVQHQRKSANKK